MHTMGLLSVKGTIDLNQFWPHGASDADTCQVTLQGPFTFTSDTGVTQETHVFENALMIDEDEKESPVLHTRAGSTTMTVHFQGIDAPESHFSPVSPRMLVGSLPGSITSFSSMGVVRS